MPKKVKVQVTDKVHAVSYKGVRYLSGDVLEVSPDCCEDGLALGTLEKVMPPTPETVEKAVSIQPEEPVAPKVEDEKKRRLVTKHQRQGSREHSKTDPRTRGQGH